jgi:hypothetical protein
MKKYKLKELDIEKLGRGWVFRFPNADPNEDFLDLLLRENKDSPSEYTLMIMSGFDAGCDLINLPSEAGSLKQGIARDWVIKNWETWIYPECPVEQVEVFRLAENQIYND